MLVARSFVTIFGLLVVRCTFVRFKKLQTWFKNDDGKTTLDYQIDSKFALLFSGSVMAMMGDGAGARGHKKKEINI